MHLITLFRVMNPHQRCLHAEVKYRNEPKHAKEWRPKYHVTIDSSLSNGLGSIYNKKICIRHRFSIKILEIPIQSFKMRHGKKLPHAITYFLFLLNSFFPCRYGLVVSVSASNAVVRWFAPRHWHTEDHRKNYTNCFIAWHAGNRVGVAGSVWNCIWGHVL